jgi:hypothetical protein
MTAPVDLLDRLVEAGIAATTTDHAVTISQAANTIEAYRKREFAEHIIATDAARDADQATPTTPLELRQQRITTRIAPHRRQQTHSMTRSRQGQRGISPTTAQPNAVGHTVQMPTSAQWPGQPDHLITRHRADHHNSRHLFHHPEPGAAKPPGIAIVTLRLYQSGFQRSIAP